MSLVEMTQWSGNLKLQRSRDKIHQVQFVQDSRKPYLSITLYDEDGSAVDLSGATITFSMLNLRTNEVKVDAQACTDTGFSSGQFEYRWADGDLDTVGMYVGEFTITITSIPEKLTEMLEISVRPKVN